MTRKVHVETRASGSGLRRGDAPLAHLSARVRRDWPLASSDLNSQTVPYVAHQLSEQYCSESGPCAYVPYLSYLFVSFVSTSSSDSPMYSSHAWLGFLRRVEDLECARRGQRDNCHVGQDLTSVLWLLPSLLLACMSVFCLTVVQSVSSVVWLSAFALISTWNC